MNRHGKRYLTVIRLGERQGGGDRYLAPTVAIAELAKSLSRGQCHMAFSSASGETFGLFLLTDKAAAQIRATIERSQITRNGDQIFVVELGEEFAAIGNSAGWQWLQHH